MNLNIFPNLLIIGNQVQVIEPLAVDSTQLTWWSTTLTNVPPEINAMRMRHQEDFPSFGEPDDQANFEEAQRGKYRNSLADLAHSLKTPLAVMQNAIEEIRYKGHEITKEEELGCLCAILFHDIGHGPFSHALEHSIVDSVHHEQISAYLMERLNKESNGKFDIADELLRIAYSLIEK
jgi:signal transduction histidine kinase